MGERSAADRRCREAAADDPSAGPRLEYAEAVFALVAMIPAGKVLSYGDVAELLGSGGPRQVGKAIGSGSEVCWWRVVRSNGTLAPELHQRAGELWEREGTPCTPSGVKMKPARWIPTEDEHLRIEKLVRRLPIPKRHPRMI